MRDKVTCFLYPLFRWVTAYLGACGFILYGKDSPDPPDYTPMANASKEAALIGAQLGREQLAENRRQYDANVDIARPIIDAQGRLTNQAYQQGSQNYDTFSSEGRPVQQAMLYDALGLNTDEISQYRTLSQQAIDQAREEWAATHSSQISDIDSQIAALGGSATNGASSGTFATADGRTWTSGSTAEAPTQAYAQRVYNQAMKKNPGDGSILVATGKDEEGNDTYGWAKPVSSTPTTAVNQDQIKELQAKRDALAAQSFDPNSVDRSSANDYLFSTIRTAKQRLSDEAAGQAIADARAGTAQQQNQLLRQGMRYGWSPAKIASMGTTAALTGASTQVAAANQARTQADAKRTAKMGDVYNTYAGLGSNAPAFYSAGTQAGNSAVGNQNQTSAQYLNGMNQGNGTIMQGQNMRIQGLGSILGAQTSAYNAAASSEGSGTGALIGAAGTVAAAFI